MTKRSALSIEDSAAIRVEVQLAAADLPQLYAHDLSVFEGGRWRLNLEASQAGDMILIESVT